mgnify:FL=1
MVSLILSFLYKQNNVNLGVMDKIEHVKILLDSFEKLVQKQIIVRTGDAVKDLKLIDEGAFALVSHNAEKDPILNYGNQFALDLWDLNWDDFIKTPSRKTAEIDLRTRREEVLEIVIKKGFYDEYEGVRISSKGKRFRIKNAIIWNVLDKQNGRIGQAAYFTDIEYI